MTGVQTCALPIYQEAFEIILVVPPDFPQREKLSELAGPGAHLEYSQQSHDIALCAVGASVARGKYLFFTESHCWPEADVLKLCLQAFREHADWAGMSCSSVRVCHNRLSVAEADMYDADIAYGMNVHPWRDRKSTRLNSSHRSLSRMPSSA